MPDGPAPLAATYRLLTRDCPQLAVSVIGTNFTRPTHEAPHGLDDAPAGAGSPERTTVTAVDAPAGVAGPGVLAGPRLPGALTGPRPPRVLVDPRSPGGLGALVDGEADRIEAAHGRRPRRDVAASRFLHHYLWSVGLLFTGPWYLTGRVPALPASALTADPATGAFTLDAGQVADGPRGTGGGAEAVRAAVAEHIRPVLEAFAPLVRRGPRALWGMATDDLASGLWFLGRARGEEDRGIRAAGALLPGGTPPFPGAADFRVLRGPSGRPHPTRTRLGCCLYYAVSPAAPCLTCPRLTDAARLQRLEAV